tara:strand:+ start:920 stop:1234 length:315 start_codon:yes stop_codon:yes gene_type:complete
MDASDNNKKQFPARMSDGRFITNFNSSCVTNQLLSDGENSYTYRQKLINHAEEIMEQTNKYYEENLNCESCYKMLIPKVKYHQDCDGDYCTIKKVSDGIGIDNV